MKTAALTEPELEQVMAIAAYVVLRHGDAYVPLLDRLEQELVEIRRKTSNRDRARRILESMSTEVRNALVA